MPVLDFFRTFYNNCYSSMCHKAIKRYSTVPRLGEATCPICTSHFIDYEVSALICGHTFHQECIQLWLETSNTCPICRMTINKAGCLVKNLYFTFEEAQVVNDATQKIEELEDICKQLQEALVESDRRTSVPPQEMEVFKSQPAPSYHHFSHWRSVMIFLEVSVVSASICFVISRRK